MPSPLSPHPHFRLSACSSLPAPWAAWCHVVDAIAAFPASPLSSFGLFQPSSPLGSVVSRGGCHRRFPRIPTFVFRLVPAFEPLGQRGVLLEGSRAFDELLVGGFLGERPRTEELDHVLPRKDFLIQQAQRPLLDNVLLFRQ